MTASRRSLIGLFALVMAFALTLPATAAAYRYTIPYNEVDLYTVDLYSPVSATVFLGDAVISKRDNATVTFYTDAACTQKVASEMPTLTGDTQFWVKASMGSWVSPVRSFWVYVSGTQMTLEAKCDDKGVATLTAVVGRGNKRRVPTGEVAFYLDGSYLGSAVVGTSGRAVFSFAAPGSGSYNVQCQYYGDENFSFASAEIGLTATAGSLVVSDKAVTETLGRFGQYYRNRLGGASIVKSGTLTVTSHYILDIDLSGFDTDDLHFYLYNPSANSYGSVNAYLDMDGRVNLITASSGVLIVSEGPLEKR